MATEETGKGKHDIVIILKATFDEVLQQAAEEITRIIHTDQSYHLKTSEEQKKIDILLNNVFDVWTAAYYRIIQISQEDQAMLPVEEIPKRSFFGKRQSNPSTSHHAQQQPQPYSQQPMERQRPPKTPWYETTKRFEPRQTTAQTQMREDPIDDEQREFEEFQNWKRSQSRNGQNRIPYNKK